MDTLASWMMQLNKVLAPLPTEVAIFLITLSVMIFTLIVALIFDRFLENPEDNQEEET